MILRFEMKTIRDRSSITSWGGQYSILSLEEMYAPPPKKKCQKLCTVKIKTYPTKPSMFIKYNPLFWEFLKNRPPSKNTPKHLQHNKRTVVETFREEWGRHHCHHQFFKLELVLHDYQSMVYFVFRDFVNLRHWQKMGKGYFSCNVSVKYDQMPPVKQYIR